MNPKRLFTCAECGGAVVAKIGLGRTVEYRSDMDPIPIPSGFVTMECDTCGERYETPEGEQFLTKYCEKVISEKKL